MVYKVFVFVRVGEERNCERLGVRKRESAIECCDKIRDIV